MASTPIKNLDWLRKRVSWVIRFDPLAADEAFAGPQSDPWLYVDQAINWRYKRVIDEVASAIDPDFFKVSDTIKWPIGQQNLPVTSTLDRTMILDYRLVTNGFPGQQITPTAGYTFSSEIYWSSNNVLTWGNTGPVQEELLMITHVGVAKDMSEPMDEPWLLSYSFRDMLSDGAAIDLLTDRQGDEIPSRLVDRFDKALWQYKLACQRASAASGSYSDVVPISVLPYGRQGP
jgi:hypothetical protein